MCINRKASICPNPKGKYMEKLNERDIAVDILTEIICAGGYNNVTLRKALNNKELLLVQKAFVTEAVNGVLRNIILIDYIIDRYSKTSTKKMKPVILNAIRLAVYQIKFMNKVPDSAACNSAVDFVKRRGFAGLSGFVNGVIRNIIRNMDVIEFPDERIKPIEFLEVMYSHPKWLVERFVSELGYDKTKEMLIANNGLPEITLCVNTIKTNKTELKGVLEKEGVLVTDSKFMNNSLHVSKTSDMTSLRSYKDGLYHVMDESAMLAVSMAAPAEGQTVIDLCAAPGGKSFAAAYLTNDKAKIFSFDIYEHKIELIKSGAKRLGLKSISAGLADGTKHNEALDETADVLIIDAPCSGLGLLQKKPDARLTKKERDIHDLAQLQRDIISASWRYVKKGGVLLYSTCTLTKEENSDNIQWILDTLPFKEEEIRQILPQDYGTDGFYIAKLRKC